mgnify:CR=1 FL=1
MRKFHGRWTIRPHPADPQHASLSTLDQVGVGGGTPRERQRAGAAAGAARNVALEGGAAGACLPLPAAAFPWGPPAPAPSHHACLFPQDLALGVYMPPPFDRILKRISCNQVNSSRAPCGRLPTGLGLLHVPDIPPPAALLALQCQVKKIFEDVKK